MKNPANIHDISFSMLLTWLSEYHGNEIITVFVILQDEYGIVVIPPCMVHAVASVSLITGTLLLFI